MSDDGKRNWLQDLGSELDKKYGKQPVPFVKYSLATPCTQLNCALGKGLPAGRLIEVIGNEQSGKTATVSSWAACAQQYGGLVWWSDTEAKFDMGLGGKVGLSFDDSVWRYDQPRNLEEWQQAFENAVKAVEKAQSKEEHPTPAMFVLDSVATLGIKDLSQAQVLQTNLRPMSAPQQWTHFFQRSIWQKIFDLHLYVVFINQLRDNPDILGYGGRGERKPSYKTPGGRALTHMQGIRIFTKGIKFCKSNDMWFETWEEKDVAYGYNVEYLVEKNAFGAPWRKAKIPFLFHKGFDDPLGSLAYLREKGILQYRGGYKMEGNLVGNSLPEVLTRIQQDREFQLYCQNLCCSVYQTYNTYEPEDFLLTSDRR